MKAWPATCLLAAACASVTGGHDPADGSTGAATATGSSDAAGESTATTGASTGGDVAASTGSGGDSSGAAADTDTTGASDPIEDAIDRGIEGALSLADQDIVLLLLMDVAHRRFAVAAFADAAAQYDATVAMQTDPPIDAYAFRRVFDPGQSLGAEQLAEIAPGPNRVTVPALFCDQLPLLPDYDAFLVEQAALGSYELTHVALALDWLDELGCPPPVDDVFHAHIAADTLALVDASDGLEDLEIEAAFFAALLAGPEVVPPGVADATVAAQLPDGTWPHQPADVEGNPHATGLALLLLLELAHAPAGPFIATR